MKTPPLVTPGPALTVDEVRRYSRHLIIPDVAMAGQQRLMNAEVLCVGAGGLGSPALMYLAAAGIYALDNNIEILKKEGLLEREGTKGGIWIIHYRNPKLGE